MKDQAAKTIETESLEIAYLEHGTIDGWPVILSHGFPYDAHAFDEVAGILIKAGARVFAPFTRGYGETRFKSANTIRSGQQTARGKDIIQFSQALALQKPIIGGFDWGGNSSCTAAILWPEQVGGLVSYAGYDIVNIEDQQHAAPPSLERVCWYQHLFQSERGRECLANNRYELARMLWTEWSPNWKFNDATFARTAAAFDNPDFVDVVIHTYRWMLGHSAGDPALQPIEDLVAQKPKVTVPTITIDGAADPLKPGGTASHKQFFAGQHEHIVTKAGHNVPQEAPQTFADAILKVHSWIS